MEHRDEARAEATAEATTKTRHVRRAPHWLQSAVATIEGAAPLDEAIERLRQRSAPLTREPAAPILRGQWLGHAVHPLLTDFPLGCWMAAGILDIVGGRGSRRAAQRLVGAGLLAVPATGATGLSDWATLHDQRSRRVGFVHAAGNTAVALLYVGSWRARRRGRHGRGIALGMLGAVGGWATGYLGGHLSFGRGAGMGPRGLTADNDTDGASDETLIDLTAAGWLLGVPPAQVEAMVEQGMLEPVVVDPEPRFRDSEVRALRLLGA
jgi:uncharacterized membrane protein